MIKRVFRYATIFVLSFLFSRYAEAQDRWNRIDKDLKAAVAVDTIKQGKYTLVFIDKSSDFNQQVKEKLIETFFINYPKEAKIYNKKTTRNVIFVIDPEYTGVAAAGGGIVRFNPEWFKKNPGDIDVVTHEVMHLVQSYPEGAGPGWITEGIADYVRYTLGIDNAGANWKLTDFDSKQSYENAYRITARFFYWMETTKKKGIIKKLDAAMRNKEYTETFWQEHLGKNVDELWEEYAENPVIG
ncbi:secretory protein [Olivibacter sp. SDN3]|uniref:basic secretory protein-like protein n=1 Tax=Olivibacter sp. SDN3 TaxID=2764720 RepID=UPI0016517585|nr:basic secretory protein-like protein [Olivibacter sp. SDN3]QNL52079.1 secretory protein [Olivibacter sp. SDN3]